MKYIQKFIEKVKYEALINDNEIVGCTEEEIIKLKTKVEKKDYCLPEAYVEFLRFGGHQIGAMLNACDFNYTYGFQRFKTIQKKLKKGKKIFGNENITFPKNGFQFIKTDGYGAFFLMDGIMNPFIYEFYTEDDIIYDDKIKFNDFIIRNTNNYISSRNGISLKKRLILSSIKRDLLEIKNYLKKKSVKGKKDLLYDIKLFVKIIDEFHCRSQEEIEKRFLKLGVYITDTYFYLPKIKNELHQQYCKEKITRILEHIEYKPSLEDENLLKTLKEMINNYFSSKENEINELLDAKDYLNTWTDLEIKTDDESKDIRTRAKWFRPQLEYYFYKKKEELLSQKDT